MIKVNCCNISCFNTTVKKTEVEDTVPSDQFMRDETPPLPTVDGINEILRTYQNIPDSLTPEFQASRPSENEPSRVRIISFRNQPVIIEANENTILRYLQTINNSSTPIPDLEQPLITRDTGTDDAEYPKCIPECCVLPCIIGEELDRAEEDDDCFIM